MNEQVMIPYIVYEGEMARAERRHKRNFVLTIVLIAALILSNLGWLYAWMQYDYSDSEIMVDAGVRGNASYIGNNGEVNYGEDNCP